MYIMYKLIKQLTIVCRQPLEQTGEKREVCHQNHFFTQSVCYKWEVISSRSVGNIINNVM